MKRIILTIILTLVTLVPAAMWAQSHPAEKYGWGFVNYGSATLNWDTYRRGFFGIPVDSNSSWYTATFDRLYYDLLVKQKLSDPNGDGVGDGTCYGMQALSLMCNKYGGYLGFCAPTIMHSGDTAHGGAMGPFDPRLRKACDIMHVHQTSLDNIELYLDQVLGGKSQNGGIGVQLARQTIGKEGPCLVSITQKVDISGGGGHVVIGYDVTGGAGKDSIWVIDPNRIWLNTGSDQREYYTGKKNFIARDGSQWRYRMAGRLSDWPTNADTVAMSPLGAGHLIIIPLTVAGPTGRTPTSLGLSVAQLLAKIFLFSNQGGTGARVLQVTDARGRRLFVPGTRQVDWSNSTGIGTMAPWAPFSLIGQSNRAAMDLFFNRGAMPSADVQLNTGTMGSTFAAGHNDAFVTINYRTPGVVTGVRYQGLTGPLPTVELSGVTKPVTADVRITLASVVPGDTTLRTYTLKNVTIPAGTTVRMTVEKENNGVRFGGTVTGGGIFEYGQHSSVAEKNSTRTLAVGSLGSARLGPADLQGDDAQTGH